MEVVWNNKKVFKLIELYKTHHILWDTSARDNKNKFKKNNAWDDISKILSIPKREIEIKIHTLRSQFAREKKKFAVTKTTGKGAAEPETSRWMFYEPLKFLFGVTTTGGSSNRRIDEEKDISDSEQPSTYSNRLTPPPPSPVTLSTNSNSQKAEKRKNTDNLCEVLDIIETVKRKMDQTKDEFDVYGHYVASELRSAKNEHAMLQAKYLINNILIEMRMGKFDQKQRCESFSRRSQSSECESLSVASTRTPALELQIENIEELTSHIKSENSVEQFD